MKASDELWRLFIAIELPANIRARVQAHIDHLRKATPATRASWAREENLHLTLKFLGETPLPGIEALAHAVQRAAARSTTFQIGIGGCGAFPARGRPRVLWIGIEDFTGALGRLYAGIEDECTDAGFPSEARPFHPHLTVGRMRQPHGALRLAQLHQQLGFGQISFEVSDVCLVRSELRSEGSRYTVIARHPLDGSGTSC